MLCCTIEIPAPFGTVFVATNEGADEAAGAVSGGLCGLWFTGQRYFPAGAGSWTDTPDHPLFVRVRAWLGAYFRGERPPVDVPLTPLGTPFRQAVWQLLREIPYGQTVTYGALAGALSGAVSAASNSRGKPVSARAVGGAVGHNPVSLMIPCHRVIGASGSLTGYAGGLERKAALLRLEGVG